MNIEVAQKVVGGERAGSGSSGSAAPVQRKSCAEAGAAALISIQVLRLPPPAQAAVDQVPLLR